MLHEYDYIFYVSPEGVEIEDNGVRTTDAKYRTTIDETIKYFTTKIPFLLNQCGDQQKVLVGMKSKVPIKKKFNYLWKLAIQYFLTNISKNFKV